MQSLAGFILLAVLASPALAQTPTVSLLIDHDYPSSGTLNIKSVLKEVSTRKGAPFHFGSTYETSYPSAWTKNIYQSVASHLNHS
jgi:endo-1,4-beta-xylanase